MRVAAHQGRASGSIDAISSTLAVVAVSAAAAFSKSSVMCRKRCLAIILSTCVTSVPSTWVSCGNVPMINERYPSKSAHGFPIKNSCRKLWLTASRSSFSNPLSVMKFMVRSSLTRDSHFSKFSMVVTLFIARFKYSIALSLRTFSMKAWRLAVSQQAAPRERQNAAPIFGIKLSWSNTIFSFGHAS